MVLKCILKEREVVVGYEDPVSGQSVMGPPIPDLYAGDECSNGSVQLVTGVVQERSCKETRESFPSTPLPFYESPFSSVHIGIALHHIEPAPNSCWPGRCPTAATVYSLSAGALPRPTSGTIGFFIEKPGWTLDDAFFESAVELVRQEGLPLSLLPPAPEPQLRFGIEIFF